MSTNSVAMADRLLSDCILRDWPLLALTAPFKAGGFHG